MAQKYPNNYQQCALCEFWSGARETDAYRSWVTVEGASAKGKCLCQGGYKNQQMQANSHCSSFRKWSVLK